MTSTVWSDKTVSNEKCAAVMSSDTSDEHLHRDAIRDIAFKDVKIVAERFTNDKSVRVVDYEIHECESYRLGFSAAYSILKIVLQKDTATQTAIFFVKSMPRTSKVQTDFLKNKGIFFTEYKFYKTLLPELSKHCECAKWYPTCYYVKKNAIVMEDLTTQGYRMLGGIFDDFVKLKSVLTSLARFHGFFMVAEARLNQNSQCPKTLKDRYPSALEEKIYLQTGMNLYFLNASVDMVRRLAKILDLNHDKIPRVFEKVYDMIEPSEIHRNGVCHGSPHGSNFMFDGGSPLPNCVLVDYQLLRYAPLVTDLLQISYLNCTRAFREENEGILVEHYHSVLEETIRSNDAIDIVEVPTLEELLLGMDDLRMFGLIAATVYLPTIVMDSNVSREYIEKSYKDYVYGDRMHKILSHMKRNSFYKNVLESVVEEFVERADVLYA